MSKNKYQKVLVTGKTGTLGSNLPYPGISSKDYDLTNFVAACRMIEDKRPDAIINCSAKVGGLQKHLQERYSLFIDNCQINFNVLEVARKYNVKRVLSFLSSCVFSEQSTPPYNESQIHDAQPFKVHEPYGHSKRFLEIQSRYLYEEFGMIANCAVPVNMAGPGEDFNLTSGHCVGVLIRKAFEASKNGTDFICWGSGREARNFLYTKNAATLTTWMLEEYHEKEPLILCDNNLIEIGYVAELIADEFDIKKKLKFDTSKNEGQKIRSLSGNKLKSLNSFEFTPIETIIKDTCDWFKTNYPNVRL